MDLFGSRHATAASDTAASRERTDTRPSPMPAASSAVAALSALDEHIAAVRVLRVLHSSPRRRLLVVHDEGGTPRVMKHWSRHDDRVDRELRALDRARGDHVVRLIDVGDDGDGVAAVLERAERGDLARLLRDRATISSGELVTIMAPLASTVARLHRAGVAHGRITAHRVLFDSSGAPQLCGFGGAELFEHGLAPAHLERLESVRRDRDAVALLARSLAERITGGAGRRALDAVQRAAADPDDPLGRLSAELFAFSSGSPVRFPIETDAEGPAEPLAATALPRRAAVAPADAMSGRGDHADLGGDGDRTSSPGGRRRARRREGRGAAGSGSSGSVGRATRRQRERGERIGDGRAARSPRRSRRTGSAGDPTRTRDAMASTTHRRTGGDARRRIIGEALDGAPVAAARAWAARVALTQSPRRRRGAVALGSAAAAALLVFLLVPGPSAAETPRPEADATGTSSVPPASTSSAATADREAATDRAGDKRSDSAAPSTAAPDRADKAVQGDDPLAAARALLTLRRDSLRELDVQGLARVLDPGSTAAADDRALLERLDAGSATVADRARVDLAATEVSEQLGDAVVIRLAPNSDPASLLLIRGEAGWRIRAYSSAAG
ncbi:protein kinase domain-containing protein [Schumannella soli]|nr:protein kinase [Schumannella soli]